MGTAVLEHPPVPPGAVPHGPSLTGLPELVVRVVGLLQGARVASVDGLSDEALGELIGGVAEVESRATALRMRLSAEADRRRVAEQTAETGTDAWLARLTGSSREQAAGGLRLARLLEERYAATRAAFAAGRLRVDQVRVIVQAAEQAPAEATDDQVAAAEEWLVAKATGDGTRSGRGLDAKRLRQTARRMFRIVDHDLAARHETILLGRETRTAEAETFLAVHDNGDGSFSGRFRIPELHGHLLTAALDRLTSPRRLSRDRSGEEVTDVTAPGTGHGANIYETSGAAFCELIEHLPVTGWPGAAGNNGEILATIDLEALTSGLGSGLGSGRVSVRVRGRPGWTPGRRSPPARPAGWPAAPAWCPRSSTVPRCRWTRAAHDGSTAATSAAPWP